MQTSCLIASMICIFLAENHSCTNVKKNYNFAAEKTRTAIPREGHAEKDDTTMQDVDVRAILIRCPQENENEVFHSNPKSISNISALRTEAILQFPGYDSDEATFQSNVVKCRRKIAIYLRIRKNGKKTPEEQYIIVDHVFDQLTGKKARLLNAYVLKIKQEPSFEMYGLKFVNVVNGEATEEVISKSTSNYTGCDDSSDNPTCGFSFYKNERVPYSQGFCCSCDASVNTARQQGCHHAPHDGTSLWKPDDSFRQPGKAFETSKTISESKINMVKENAMANYSGDEEQKENHESRHQGDVKKQKCTINVKSCTKASNKLKGKHRSDKNKSGKEIKSTTSETRKWRTSTENVSEAPTSTNPCAKQPEKKSRLIADVGISNANSTCNEKTGWSTTPESQSLKLENCSSSTQSDITQPKEEKGTVTEPNSPQSQITTPSNFSVTTESTSLKTTTILLASEMYRVSSNLAKEQSGNTITGSPSVTLPLDQSTPEKSTTEKIKVHTCTAKAKKNHHIAHSPCSEKPSTPRDPLKKYHNFLPTDQPDGIKEIIKMAKDSLENKSQIPIAPINKNQSFSPKEKPSQSNNEADDVTIKATRSTTKSPRDGEVSSTAGNSTDTSTPTNDADKMTTETSTPLNDLIKKGKDGAQTQSAMRNDSEIVSVKVTATETPKEKCSSKTSDSLSSRQNLATNAKWTDDKFNEGDKDTATKFTANSLLELSGLDSKVNNLHSEPVEFSTEDVLNSLQLSDANEILSVIKDELKDNEYRKSSDYADVGEATGFKKKEIISKNIKNILAESKTVSTPLENLGDFDLDKVNDVSSEPLTKDSELSKHLTQDEINDIILASDQELEIEPHLSRKRRKETAVENCEENTSESDDGSSNPTRISCSAESASEKNTIKHLTTRAPTTQKHSATKTHAPKKHNKLLWLFKQKNTSSHANCTRYPSGPCLSKCGESTTEAFVDDDTHKSLAESIKRTIERTPSQLEKSAASRKDTTEKRIDTSAVLTKMSPAMELKENLPPSIDSAVHANVHGGLPGKVELNRHADAFPTKNEGHLLHTNFGRSKEIETSGSNIENSRLQSSPAKLAVAHLSQQVDLAGTQGKHVKNTEGSVHFSSGSGRNDDETISDAYEKNLALIKASKSPRDESFLQREVKDSFLGDSLEEDNLLQTKDDNRLSQQLTFGNEDMSEQGDIKTKRFSSTRRDYLDELARERNGDKYHSGKTISKREAIYETPDEEINLDSAISGGDQQVKSVISDGTSKSDDRCPETKDTGLAEMVNSGNSGSNDPVIVNSACIQEKPENPTEQNFPCKAGKAAVKLEDKNIPSLKGIKTKRSCEENSTIVSTRSTNNVQNEVKENKNCTECIRINPLSKMPSITEKLNSLKNVSKVTASKPLVISPAVVRLKSQPNTEPPPDTAEGKLNVILKEFQQKLLPLIEDAEDKKVIEAEEKSNRHKKSERVTRPYTHKRLAKRNTIANRIKHFVTNVKQDVILNKGTAPWPGLLDATDVKGSHVPVRSEIKEVAEEMSNDNVGYLPHYITDHVPLEKAKMLDLKNGAKRKDKENCCSAVLNMKSSRTSGANDFERGTKDRDRNERSQRREPDNCSYLELLAAIAADSIREQSFDEKLPIDNINAGIDTPIYESSFNLLENDYASFAEDEEDEYDDESESFHRDKTMQKKSVVSKDSLSLYPVSSSKRDYDDTTDLDGDKRSQENKQLAESRSKRNPHGGVRKNHLKINISKEREDKPQANNNENKERKIEKCYNSDHKSDENADRDYIPLRITVDDEIGVSQLEYDEDLSGDDNEYSMDSNEATARRKRQVLAGGHQIRGGQNCADRSTPPNVNPKSYHESAHCLRFSDLWYTVYKVNEPEIVRTIYVQIFEKHIAEDGSAQWEDHTKGKMISLGTNNPKPLDFLPALSLEYHSVDDCPLPFSLNASRVRLLIPQPVPKEKMPLYPQLQGGPGEYLVLDESLVASDGDACDVAGVGYEGFARQDDRCGRPRDSCLRNQPVQFWREDIQARIEGRKGSYLLENFAAVPDNPIKTDKNDEQFLALEFHEKQESFVAIELKADFNSIIRVGTSAQITEIRVDSTMPGTSELTFVVTNTGLASARYRARVTDCPLQAPREWEGVETPLHNIAPQRNAEMQLSLEGDMVGENMHCSVEVLNEDRELVATRRFRLELNDRCFCVWWCLCACIGTVDGLKCRPQSQHHHHAGGFEGGVPFAESPSRFDLSSVTFADLTGDWVTLLLLLFFVMLLIALLLGLTKALIGICCCPVVGAWGLFIMALGPVRIKEYYEEELQDEEVVYDQRGYPVHPVTGYHNVQAVTAVRQFLYNLAFFVLLLPAICCRCCCRCCLEHRERWTRWRKDGCEEDGCNDNMCFDSYANDDAREAEATDYVLGEMAEHGPEVVANYANFTSERTPLLREAMVSPTRGASSKRSVAKAEKMARSFLKQKFVYRGFMEPIGGIEFPADVPYCIKGHLVKDDKGPYLWVPTKPLLQYWTFNGDLFLMKPPKQLDPNLFVLRYKTPEKLWNDGWLSKVPIGFCINVTIQDEIISWKE